MKSRHKRFAFIAVGLVAVGVATALIINAFNDNMMLFVSPTDVLAKKYPQGRDFRIGGLVEKGSVKRQQNGITVDFTVSDTVTRLKVDYTGILPDLFKEGQGVVAHGRLGADGVFHAHEVLAKHDEKYTPPEVTDAIKRAKANSAAAGQKL